jgi:hypothetical protein
VKLRQQRREEFADRYLGPLITEAAKLGLSTTELKDMIDTWEK